MTKPIVSEMDEVAVAASVASRRGFIKGAASLATLAGLLPGVDLFGQIDPLLGSKRILLGSDTTAGILAFDWESGTGALKAEGVAGVVAQSTWIALSPDRRFLYVACELDEFQGKPTGAVASFKVDGGKLTLISQVPSMGKGTCHLTTDQTGRVVICANYAGGSAASFLVKDGKLGAPAWSEQYKGYAAGSAPVPDRQEMAHAHFASVSPDNRFVYINDLGSDKIHIYWLDTATGKLAPAGAFAAKPGAGPRTLHFHSNGKFAYCMNELNSTVTVLEWKAENGALNAIQTVELLPEGTATKHGSVTNTGCDTVLTRDGQFAYFANRGDDFLIGFHVDAATGKLTAFSGNPRTSCGGTTPRNFALDPTERWMLVANQQSSNLSVFKRDTATGVLANEGKNIPAATPMCIVFV